ncbi:histidine phosphatase family protein [Evansella tamaricis]|uniref:Histidine phosphatase family protein n=1 Tax=Evansella tamaricis TaxID=2069301 RepID=A0ABS6JCC6_9BACI|nr:histidine phosphatase family protein [Evansella tamaricis]MBU9710844.1 histidine phosphatase family protein [Evansella tamaricis]
MILYLIRHGQSEANLKGIIQGHRDYPLSHLGKKQALLLGKYFGDSKRKVDLIYSSDLTRAYLTAKEIAYANQKTVTSLEILREVGLGPLEGLTRAEMKNMFPLLKPESLLTSGISGTEEVESITSRCLQIKNMLSQIPPDKTVVMVSHGGFISMFLMYLMAGEQWMTLDRPFIIGNTGVSKIEWNKGTKTKFHYINRLSHLESEAGFETASILY